jgi:hypothetical protein
MKYYFIADLVLTIPLMVVFHKKYLMVVEEVAVPYQSVAAVLL